MARKPPQKHGNSVSAKRAREGWRDKVLQLVGQGHTLTTAAEASGITRQQVYAVLDADQAFRKQYDGALAEAADRMEREMWRRAVQGVEDLVTYQGAVCYHLVDANGNPCEQVIIDGKRADPPGSKRVPLVERKYSDGLLQFMMKNRRKEVYGDKMYHKLDGGVPQNVVIEVVGGEGGDGATSEPTSAARSNRQESGRSSKQH